MAIAPITNLYEYGVAVRSFLGEPTAGDAGLVIEEDNGLFVAIVDVLGHGPEAHEVASGEPRSDDGE